MNDAGNDMNGYEKTQIMLAKTPLSDYPAFQAIKDYSNSHAVPNNINRSPWFMPSVGQWFDLMANLGGKSPTTWENISSSSGWWNEMNDAPNMFDKINNQLDKVNIDDSTFFPNPDSQSHFYCSTSETALNGDNDLWGLLISSDYYDKKDILTVLISTMGKTATYSIRPFFAF